MLVYLHMAIGNILCTVIRYILRLLGIFYIRLVYFVVIWYNLPVLVRCFKKNLANLLIKRTN
jgi:hypothetical protein